MLQEQVEGHNYPVVSPSSSVFMIKRIPNHHNSPNQTILMQSLHLENRLLSEYRRHSPHSPRITMGKMTSDNLKKGKKKYSHPLLFAVFFIDNNFLNSIENFVFKFLSHFSVSFLTAQEAFNNGYNESESKLRCLEVAPYHTLITIHEWKKSTQNLRNN